MRKVKLSELNNDDMLLVGESLVISKEDYLNEIQEHEGEKVYTTTEWRASLDARDMLDREIECEADNMYESWDCDIWNDVTNDDIREMQLILNRILNRSENISYRADKEVEIDI